MKINKLFLLSLVFLLTTNVYAKENLFYYEEALRTEKVSPLFSLQLYETFLKQNPPKKYSIAVVFRLFDIYYNLNKTEELLILSETYTLDKSRVLRLEILYEKLSKIIGITSDEFKKIIKLIINKDNNSKEALLEICKNKKNSTLQNYIFALKFKMNDIDSISYLVRQISDINPILLIIYNIKENNPNLKQIIEDYVPITSNDEYKKEIFYLYGLYLTKNRRYKEAIRFYKMSNSYSANINNEYVTKSTMEISKNLYIKGYSEEACLQLSKKKLFIQNESDEFLKIYCDHERSSELLKIVNTLKFLSKKDNGLVFKRFIYDKNI
jgi:hypothetical protein